METRQSRYRTDPGAVSALPIESKIVVAGART